MKSSRNNPSAINDRTQNSQTQITPTVKKTEQDRGFARDPASFLEVLQKEKASGYAEGIYSKIMIDMTYHSNRIEGNRLRKDQVREIFETNSITHQCHVFLQNEGTQLNEGSLQTEVVRPYEVFFVDDIIETAAHFRCINLVIEHAKEPLSETFIKQLHLVLKTGTSDDLKDWFAVGDYKKLPNTVGGQETCPPEEVGIRMKQLLAFYNKISKKTLDDLLTFHVEIERIHPFQDGNGRIGRLILFKECLKNNLVPFIIQDDFKQFYYRGLRE